LPRPEETEDVVKGWAAMQNKKKTFTVLVGKYLGNRSLEETR
jgi:hypothetical protein